MKILAEITVDDVVPHMNYSPPAMTIYGHYAVPPVPVVAIDCIESSSWPGYDVVETSAGITDRANTSLSIPYDRSVKAGCKIKIIMEDERRAWR